MDSFPPFVAAAITVGQPVHDFRHVERGSFPRRMTVRDLTFPGSVAPTVDFRDTPARSLPLIALVLSKRRSVRSGATRVARCGTLTQPLTYKMLPVSRGQALAGSGAWASASMSPSSRNPQRRSRETPFQTTRRSAQDTLMPQQFAAVPLLPPSTTVDATASHCSNQPRSRPTG